MLLAEEILSQSATKNTVCVVIKMHTTHAQHCRHTSGRASRNRAISSLNIQLEKHARSTVDNFRILCLKLAATISAPCPNSWWSSASSSEQKKSLNPEDWTCLRQTRCRSFMNSCYTARCGIYVIHFPWSCPLVSFSTSIQVILTSSAASQAASLLTLTT